jgi:hypothetical protein
MRSIVALFGEAEKGQFNRPHLVREVPQLIDLLGNPPEESEGIHYAIQTLMFQRDLLFFRVEMEGFSPADYFNGFKYLEKTNALHALCLPGVGDPNIIDASKEICWTHKSLLITNQKDLYDYLTTN